MNRFKIILTVLALSVAGFNGFARAFAEVDSEYAAKVFTTSSTPNVGCDTSTDCTSVGTTACGATHTTCNGSTNIKIKV